MDTTYDLLKLENQLCFPLYASARKIVAAYTPYLKKIGLTYTQYVTMMVMWEYKKLTIHDLGQKLYLDSGTLTPVIKRLEAAGYVRKYRDTTDERLVMVEITPEGEKLRDRALEVPQLMACKAAEGGLHMSEAEIEDMKKKLYDIINALK